MATAVARKPLSHKISAKPIKQNGILGWVGSVATGVALSLIVTVVGVAAFAVVIRWIAPSNTVVSVINQGLKLVAIAGGVWFVSRKNAEGALMKGAAIGCAYMLLGVVAYSLLSSMPVRVNAYLADLGMGVAGGGLCGMILPGLGKK